MSEDKTVQFPGTEQEIPPGEPELAEQPTLPGVEVPAEPEPEPDLTPTDPIERIPFMEEALRDIYQRINLLFGLLKGIGEETGMKLKSRQMPGGGVQFYWERFDKRIIRPGGGN